MRNICSESWDWTRNSSTISRSRSVWSHASPHEDLDNSEIRRTAIA